MIVAEFSVKMARGYVADSHQYVAEDERDYRPSRPARRAESTREVGPSFPK